MTGGRQDATGDGTGGRQDATGDGTGGRQDATGDGGPVEVPEVVTAGELVGSGADVGGFDLGSMLQMAQEAASQVVAAQEQLLEARVRGSAGGGAVEVVLNGQLHLLQVDISPSAVDPDDPSMLGDLVVAAFADAQRQVAELQARADPLAGLGGLGDLLGGG